MEPLPFHDVTKHSPLSVRARHGRLDWSNKPYPFKDYLELTPLPLPPPSSDTDLPALFGVTETPGEPRELGSDELARLLTLGAGVLRERSYPDGEKILLPNLCECRGSLSDRDLCRGRGNRSD